MRNRRHALARLAGALTPLGWLAVVGSAGLVIGLAIGVVA